MTQPIIALLFLIFVMYVYPSAGLTAQNQTKKSERSSPHIESVQVEGITVWEFGQTHSIKVRTGQWIKLIGTDFGEGVDTDYSKILIGKIRALERNLSMYEGDVNLAKQLFFERNRVVDRWATDLGKWTTNLIELRIPETASEGPLVVSVQKRVGWIPSLLTPLLPLRVKDPLTERIENDFQHTYEIVSRLSPPQLSNPIPLVVENPSLEKMLKLGEATFWHYDYGIGLVHRLKKLDWDRILSTPSADPLTGEPMTPEKDFGAIPLKAGEVPDVALSRYYWEQYPLQQPLKPLFGSAKKGGWVSPTKFVGYVRAEAKGITGKTGSWVGFNCASCHSQRITYEAAPGKTVSKVFPGIPNPYWSMKWAIMGGGFPSLKNEKQQDRTLITYSIPKGTGEHTLIREHGDGSIYENDYLFSPIAIPIITRHTPVRRALSRTEQIAGFEGSYIHSEEPDGAIGAMSSEALKALTVYMSSLDENDEILNRVGLYRWLKKQNFLNDVSYVSEGDFVEKGSNAFSPLKERIEGGQKTFGRHCQSCHQPNFGTGTNEDHFPFQEVGTYFSPTLFQRQVQSIRTSILRNLAWVEPRGLLHDGHVKSLRDLVHPDRCTEGSALYQSYYTLHTSTFKIPKGNAQQERALRKVPYFVEVPWDTKHLYWDYQKMRTAFGPKEFGTSKPISLPAAPHPWCVKTSDEVDNLVLYLLTL